MGLPAKRRTKQSKRERASHFALKRFTLIACSHCHRRIRPHTVCPHCGYYQGRLVMKVTSKTEKRAAKNKKARGAKEEVADQKKEGKK
ncbi:MAG: 50S ribosomal protein L32 [Candidatus Kerfeldbacteria bacterium]|nr:50S ribosomal protein L32 [Candidatus Kerfeldbacteria bacterium]